MPTARRTRWLRLSFTEAEFERLRLARTQAGAERIDDWARSILLAEAPAPTEPRDEP